MRAAVSLELPNAALRMRERIGAVAGTPLPGLAVAPAGVFGLASLMDGYAGPALRVRRVADGAETDVGFADGVLDGAAARAFAGASALTVAAWYDQSGNGRHLVQPVSASQPGLWLGEGGPAITGYAGPKPLPIPPALGVERADCSVFTVTRTPGLGATDGYWMFGDPAAGAHDLGLTSPRTGGQSGAQPMVAGASLVAAASDNGTLPVANRSVLGLVSAASGITVHRDDRIARYPAAAPMVLNAGGQVGSANAYAGRNDLLAWIVYPRALADAEAAALKAVLRGRFATVGPAVAAWTFTGDSIVFGTGGVNNRTITAALAERVGDGVLIRNLGIAGHRLAQHHGDYADPATASRHVMAGVRNVFVANYGHNDIKSLVPGSGAQAVVDAMTAQLRALCADLRRAGFDRIVWQECLADRSPGWTAEMELARGLWNDFLAAGPIGADGAPCLNGLDRVATDPGFVLSDAETAAGRGMALAANASDAIHPNEATAPARAAHVLAAIAAATPTPLTVAYDPVTTATEGVGYPGARPSASGGTPPYRYALAPGSAALPGGLALDAATGVIAGAPDASGSVTGLRLRVTDADGGTADTAAFGIVVAARAAGLLDTVAARPAGAFGLRRLDEGHAGPAIRVTRSSDGGALDIGFTAAGDLDEAALLAFVGSGTGHVETWYDQSGHGRDFGQPAPASRPRIVSAGAIERRGGRAAILFGSSTGLTGTLTGSPAARLVAAVASHNNASNGDLLTCSANGGLQFRYNGARTLGLIKPGTGVLATSAMPVAAGAPATLVASTSASAQAFAIDGIDAGTGTASFAPVPGSTARIGLTSGMNVHLSELLVFDDGWPDASDRALIQAEQRRYFATP